MDPPDTINTDLCIWNKEATKNGNNYFWKCLARTTVATAAARSVDFPTGDPSFHFLHHSPDDFFGFFSSPSSTSVSTSSS